MITPTRITNYFRSQSELLEFAIFAACVAGKNSDQTAQKVNDLWRDGGFRSTLTTQWQFRPTSDHQYYSYLHLVRLYLEKYKVGQYQRLSRIIVLLNQLSAKLDTILFQELVGYKGIGPKTAAFFLLHSRRDATLPVIDTHIIKFMASKGYTIRMTDDVDEYYKNANIVTPVMTKHCPNMTLAEADQHIWNVMSGRA